MAGSYSTSRCVCAAVLLAVLTPRCAKRLAGSAGMPASGSGSGSPVGTAQYFPQRARSLKKLHGALPTAVRRHSWASTPNILMIAVDDLR